MDLEERWEPEPGLPSPGITLFDRAGTPQKYGWLNRHQDKETLCKMVKRSRVCFLLLTRICTEKVGGERMAEGCSYSIFIHRLIFLFIFWPDYFLWKVKTRNRDFSV